MGSDIKLSYFTSKTFKNKMITHKKEINVSFSTFKLATLSLCLYRKKNKICQLLKDRSADCCEYQNKSKQNEKGTLRKKKQKKYLKAKMFLQTSKLYYKPRQKMSLFFK